MIGLTITLATLRELLRRFENFQNGEPADSFARVSWYVLVSISRFPGRSFSRRRCSWTHTLLASRCQSRHVRISNVTTSQTKGTYETAMDISGDEDMFANSDEETLLTATTALSNPVEEYLLKELANIQDKIDATTNEIAEVETTTARILNALQRRAFHGEDANSEDSDCDVSKFFFLRHLLQCLTLVTRVRTHSRAFSFLFGLLFS